ncbi:MAG TPA: heparinase II/III-family protein, partial [Telluria sp.]|nr:heparinase II/III-family protein [Telluria sp.]
TYAYHTQQRWRDYFRGTAAHNTVAVDGQDQSEIGGNFMWLRKAQARLLAHLPDAPVQVFAGEHDGYTRLADPVRHQRRVEFDTTCHRIVIKDILQCRQGHRIALHWHFAEACQVTPADGALQVRGARHGLDMRCRFGDGPRLLRGSETPPAGWISRTFDSKTPITTAVWQGAIDGTTEIVTEIDLRFAPASTTY